jgi:ribosome-associated heat shock protein Hsp15
MTEQVPPGVARQRLDKWLFFARMAKSRSLAQALIHSNNVRVNGVLASQPSFQLKAGDRINLSLGRRDLVLVVKSAGDRRGPFEEARLLYDDLTPPPEETKRLTAFEQALRQPGAGRPTKKERRQTDGLVPDVGDEGS